MYTKMAVLLLVVSSAFGTPSLRTEKKASENKPKLEFHTRNKKPKDEQSNINKRPLLNFKSSKQNDDELLIQARLGQHGQGGGENGITAEGVLDHFLRYEIKDELVWFLDQVKNYKFEDDEKRVEVILKNLIKRGLKDDITGSPEYLPLADDSCYDDLEEDILTKAASSFMNDMFGPVCWSLVEIQKYYWNKAILIGVAIHEHAHHFGVIDRKHFLAIQTAILYEKLKEMEFEAAKETIIVHSKTSNDVKREREIELELRKFKADIIDYSLDLLTMLHNDLIQMRHYYSENGTAFNLNEKKIEVIMELIFEKLKQLEMETELEEFKKEIKNKTNDWLKNLMKSLEREMESLSVNDKRFLMIISKYNIAREEYLNLH